MKQETDLDIDEMKRHDHIHESFASNAELRKRYIRTKREPGHRIFANRSLQLDRIKFSDFDMDYTLALYKSPEFEELTFQQIIESLIELDFLFSLINRRLWYDKLYRNLLKVDAHGNILTIGDGFKFLSGDRTGVKFGENILSFRAISNDGRNSVDRVHYTTKLKEMVCENIEKYVHKDEQLPILLGRIHSRGAKTFLLTNSEYWYTDKLMAYLLTIDNVNNNPKRDWKSDFSYIVVDAQKSSFFAAGTT
ncbi:unnamed protein product [Rotaria sp. Silwood1]|nr:unnamed protein product [Rotaria sp. Silwood1]